ncbi:hypothetical protein HanRHA438_Chr12g0565601 [Helianthus annuus]|uniref:Uncharacterized protein n=1 Tax=Helianthus annuus TaxID=4232 RepID=A0A9K3HIM8_HELAN|nr:hypothetical protein HanXRQr2_Chr12g0554251 [Helianthus annuus]KAJ0863749.1 hypothetical protein HanPSC8_Chr12g0533661 [Helianthus annuus]KAJ0867647.1 hypothetical protein HanRHA438_Chr12g0565601 [Helianthus annuus]
MSIRRVTSGTRPGLVTSEGTEWILFLVGQLTNTQLASPLLHKSLAINRRLNLEV